MSTPLWILAAALALAPAPAAPAAPAVTADRAQAAPGDRVLVRLAAWPPGTVTVELCGGAPDGGSAGCAMDSAVQTYVSPTGTAGTALTVAAPPGGCPCAIRATSLDRATVATTPFAVTGAAAPSASGGRSQAAPVLVAASLDGGGSWPDRLGWASTRTLVLRLRNDSPAPAPVALSVTAGRGSAPTGFVAAPAVPDLAPGEERTIAVPVELPPLSTGTYTVTGEVTSAGSTVQVVATTARYPWGVPVVLALAVTALAVTAWRRRRR
ncbi:hypothetical protein [Phytohabitans kaempferiae]|uniref:Alpha-galactosidase NEW3 domain-containing protein n=1 Tax=Phytohabitans kaempferiae TaxID=1620943 RepID=A0ABV6MAX2_9ACTN